MKKLLAASVIMLSSMSVMAATQSTQGGFNGPTEAAPLVQAQGGFNGPSAIPVLNTVKAASHADDNAAVELTQATLYLQSVKKITCLKMQLVKLKSKSIIKIGMVLQ